MIKADTVRNYIRKNYSVSTFSTKHHFKPDAIRRFLDGDSISQEALRLIIGCIEVVDNHLFTGVVPKGFRNEAI
ncbi:TPA: hypothetical protein RFV54_001065 [Klebsiella aerogenes]|nr:hypothetical protein [Klebsiella aerogenes]